MLRWILGLEVEREWQSQQQAGMDKRTWWSNDQQLQRQATAHSTLVSIHYNGRFAYLEPSVPISSDGNCSIVARDNHQVGHSVLDHPDMTILLSYIHHEMNNWYES